MGFESERGGLNPTGFESEQVAGIDQYARHGDRYERRTTAYAGGSGGLFGWDRGDGFHGGSRGAVRIHRSHRATFRLRPAETWRQGGGSALSRARQRLLAATDYPVGQTGR